MSSEQVNSIRNLNLNRAAMAAVENAAFPVSNSRKCNLHQGQDMDDVSSCMSVANLNYS